MRVVMYGSGGVGGNYGGYMARAGIDVTFVARGEHLRALREYGLKIESPVGDFVVTPAQATDNPSEIGPVDVIFVCIKAWQLEENVAALKPMIGPNTVVIPLQNWIEAADFLASRLGREHILGGLCYTISYIVRPGVVHGDGSTIIFGELDHKPSARAEALEKLIDKVPGISTKNSPDIQKEMWRKFAWIASAGALGVATRTPIGIWRKLPQTRTLFEKVLREAFAVAKAQGTEFSEQEIIDRLNTADERPEDFRTSMQRDMAAGMRSELEYQIGAIVRLAKMLNVPTPISDAIYAAALPSELRAQRKITFD